MLVAGERYGTGSSRDWAAKGQRLLGIRAVLAVSFERIHRSNLIGMGILPIRLPQGVTPQTLHLVAGDRIEVDAHAAGPIAALRSAGPDSARERGRSSRWPRSLPSRRSSRWNCSVPAA